mmetsp:Transcript_45664/g.69827  ORF Transcript_45664/g.69827 Transcript_45664/m.69827 type:complete len:464 (+) Transcript_45664:135-1526(+)
MPELTKTVVVKRPSKKTSGYKVEEKGDDYVISEVPAKARVNIGDKIVRINGIDASEFVDEDDANALIESIRIKVVPEDKIEEFDEAGGEEAEEEEEDYEEYDRSAKAKKPKSSKKSKGKDAGAIVPVPTKPVHHCKHCDHDNEDLSEDEDGDLVCEECGHVIEPEEAGGVELKCKQCSHVNKNCERDEDGDYVCEECGYTIPEDTGAAPAGDDEKDAYTCPDCGHVTIGPEPDEEGDRICEECGCILPEKMVLTCIDCNHANVDPVADEEGDYVCTECGAILPVEEEQSGADKLKAMDDGAKSGRGDGQEMGNDGKPATNKEGKKLTPADMFNPGDVITVTVGKSNPKQDAGLKVEERNGKYYVRKVPSSGLFAKTPVIAGDKVLELNGKDYHEFKSLSEMKKLIKEEMRITIVVLRKDPDDSESSASSVDYDDLAPVTPAADEQYDEEVDETALVIRDDDSD